jgi:hypothetical protein
MPKFSKASRDKLNTCDSRLIMLMEAMIVDHDFTILCGHRSKEAQDIAFKTGASKLRFPKSKHNSFPSRAVDIAPYPIDWEDTDRFIALAEAVKTKADKMGIKITWGGDFNNDGNITTNDTWDKPHFELRG